MRYWEFVSDMCTISWRMYGRVSTKGHDQWIRPRGGYGYGTANSEERARALEA
jgi:hypothetical protein